MASPRHRPSPLTELSGAGVPPYEIKDIITVVKAYSSAVGGGAFVSEILDEEEAEELRKRGGDGGEYGVATTGRPLKGGLVRCRRHEVRMHDTGDDRSRLYGPRSSRISDEIPVCVGYEIDGEITDRFPCTSKLEKAKPVLKKLPGWKCDITGIREFDKLPAEAQNYVNEIEKAHRIPDHLRFKRAGQRRHNQKKPETIKSLYFIFGGSENVQGERSEPHGSRSISLTWILTSKKSRKRSDRAKR